MALRHKPRSDQILTQACARRMNLFANAASHCRPLDTAREQFIGVEVFVFCDRRFRVAPGPDQVAQTGEADLVKRFNVVASGWFASTESPTQNTCLQEQSPACFIQMVLIWWRGHQCRELQDLRR